MIQIGDYYLKLLFTSYNLSLIFLIFLNYPFVNKRKYIFLPPRMMMVSENNERCRQRAVSLVRIKIRDYEKEKKINNAKVINDKLIFYFLKKLSTARGLSIVKRE